MKKQKVGLTRFSSERQDFKNNNNNNSNRKLGICISWSAAGSELQALLVSSSGSLTPHRTHTQADKYVSSFVLMQGHAEGRGGHWRLPPSLATFFRRQALLLNLGGVQLGCLASNSDPLVSTSLPNARARGRYHIWLFMWVLGTSTQVPRLAEQADSGAICLP